MHQKNCCKLCAGMPTHPLNLSLVTYESATGRASQMRSGRQPLGLSEACQLGLCSLPDQAQLILHRNLTLMAAWQLYIPVLPPHPLAHSPKHVQTALARWQSMHTRTG